jgi:hypothetical protein
VDFLGNCIRRDLIFRDSDHAVVFALPDWLPEFTTHTIILPERCLRRNVTGCQGDFPPDDCLVYNSDLMINFVTGSNYTDVSSAVSLMKSRAMTRGCMLMKDSRYFSQRPCKEVVGQSR